MHVQDSRVLSGVGAGAVSTHDAASEVLSAGQLTKEDVAEQQSKKVGKSTSKTVYELPRKLLSETPTRAVLPTKVNSSHKMRKARREKEKQAKLTQQERAAARQTPCIPHSYRSSPDTPSARLPPPHSGHHHIAVLLTPYLPPRP